MLGCYETLISHTVKTTLLLLHIIKLHFFFGGLWVWHFFGPYKYKYKVEKETNHDLSPMMVGMLGGSSTELSVLGLGSHPVDGRNIFNQLRLGSVSHYYQYETYSVQTSPDDGCAGVFPYLLLCFVVFV